MSLIVVIIVLSLIFDFINGFHDAANSIATIVSTKVLTPFQAVVWAAFFNFVAYFIFSDHAVANTISKTVNADFITLGVILGGMLAAIFWNLLTWWFGIPSSSSHTLIGGFAGAAICHAIIEFDGFSWGDVVNNKVIWSTVIFIFLAPMIGMLISMFITFVTVIRNVWLRIGIIAVVTSVAVFMFDMFEHSKMAEGVEKFYKVDKAKKDVDQLTIDLKMNPNDAELTEKLNKAKEKFDKATANASRVKDLVEDYDVLGAEQIAETAFKEGLVNDIAVSMLVDEVKNANGYLILESNAANHPATIPIFKEAKQKTALYKEPIGAYLKNEISVDQTIVELDKIFPVEATNIVDVKQKLMEFDVKKKLASSIEAKDNTIIVMGIVLAAIIFSLVYLYVEVYRTPNAYKISEMFKSLQLFSSAAFSIGHGGNDAQKVMGIIGAALIANGSISDFGQLPFWVPLACYAAIGLGTMSGGWKIVKTMGTKITKVTPLEGVAAETAGAFTLFFTGQMGIPVSTTHTITGSIIGVGAFKRLSAVRWGVTINLLWAWILTIPVSAAVAAFFYYIINLVGIL
ncbi:MAG: inorganic phosphate transporter [Saprospiraceae bacterium]|nr:inorganic phosphate transporter [Saprospiraceae bacterium]